MQFFKGLKAGKPGVVEAAAAAAQVAAEPVRAAARGPDPELPSLTDEEAIQRGYQATRGLSPSEVAKFHAIYKASSPPLFSPHFEQFFSASRASLAALAPR